jgi:hypothetical protein
MSTPDVTQEFATNASPVAPYTWQVGPIVLLATQPDTGFIPVRFSRPIEILGMHAVVIPVLPLVGGFTTPSLPTPTPNDIDVLMQLDQVERYTSNVTDNTIGPGYVPLQALTVTAGARLLRVIPNADAPDIQFKFAWRQFIQGTPLYQGAIISLSLYARYLPKGAV